MKNKLISIICFLLGVITYFVFKEEVKEFLITFLQKLLQLLLHTG